MPNNADLTDDESQSSSEEDEKAELVTEDVEKTFFKVFSQLKNKDPQLYKEDVNYFQNETEIQSKDPSQNKKNQLYSKKKNNGSIVKNKSDGSDNFWTSEKLSKDDMFIRDYILNKKFLGGDDVDMEEELRKLKEEEEELEEEAMFEYKFNNRYEEPPDEEFVKKYPHALGIVTEDMDHKRVVKGPKSNCNSVKYEDGKKEKTKNRKRKQDDLLVNASNVSELSKTPNLALTNIHINVSPAKKVKKHKDPKEEKFGKNERKIHSHSLCTNGVNNSNSGDKHLQKTKGSRLKSNSEEHKVREKEKLNDIKRNPDDVLVQTQSKKVLKDANILKQSMNKTPSKKVKQNIDLNIAGNVDTNKKSKKQEININKNKDYNKLPKKGNAINKLGNVKFKKNIRYKHRRKKHVLVPIPDVESTEYENSQKKQLKNHNISRDLDQKVRIETKKTLLQNKSENYENLSNGINGKETVEQEAVNKKKRKRKRLGKKLPGESVTNVQLQHIPN